MPAARSGLRSPQSDASYASRRIAANLRLIVDGAYGCCSSAIRYSVTPVLLKASLGSEQYQSTNSRMAWSYGRFELEDVRLFKTADFDCSRSGNLRTVFGTRLRLLFAIGSGLRCRGEKHDPVPDLLTSSAFVVTYRHITSRYARDTAKCVSATQQRVARRRSQLTTSHTVAAQIRGQLPRFLNMPDSEILAAGFKLSDAQEMVARQQGFEGWQALKTGLSTAPRKPKSAPSKATIVGAEPQLFVTDIQRSCEF